MPKSRGRTSTPGRYHLEATPPTGLFHHGGSLSSADSGSLNQFFSHPSSPLLANQRGGTSRRAQRQGEKQREKERKRERFGYNNQMLIKAKQTL